MPETPEKPEKGQIWMTIGPDLKQTFATWCRGNGYDKTLVFLAGWLSLLKLDYAERKTLFESVDEISRLANGQLGKPPGASSKGGATKPREAQQ